MSGRGRKGPSFKEGRNDEGQTHLRQEGWIDGEEGFSVSLQAQ